MSSTDPQAAAIYPARQRAFRFGMLGMLALFSLGTPNNLRAAQTATLQQLFDGGSITALNVTFSDFLLTSLGSTIGIDPDFTLVEVVGLEDDPLNPGLQFLSNGQFTTIDDEQITLEFQYEASVVGSGVSLGGAKLTLDQFEFADNDPATNDGGVVFITTDILGPLFTDLGNLQVEADNGQNIAQTTEQTTFAPTSSATVLALVTLAGDQMDDIVSLDAYSQRFGVVVPEPASCLLAFSLLVGATRRHSKVYHFSLSART